MTPTIDLSPLTATDRCDRCGAQAYVRTTLSSGYELLFCSHHWRDNEDRLREIAVNIHDETERLDVASATAALDGRATRAARSYDASWPHPLGWGQRRCVDASVPSVSPDRVSPDEARRTHGQGQDPGSSRLLRRWVWSPSGAVEPGGRRFRLTIRRPSCPN